MYSDLLSNPNKNPNNTNTALIRKDNTITTSKPSIPSQAPLIAKSFESPPPNAGFFIINLTMWLKIENPKIAIKNATTCSIKGLSLELIINKL